jgi:tryptophan halogenase
MKFKNKTIVIMGGGTAGWVSALYFLNKNKKLNLNLKIKLISSNDIEPIGVGEGTTPLFTHFIEKICWIDAKEFLRKTKGSFKYGIKFDNWNFDGEYYYHSFNYCIDSNHEFEDNDYDGYDYDFLQYAINSDLNIPQKILQKKIHGVSFDLLENNKIALNINDRYAYHFSANLIIPFLRKKCLEFNEFEYVQETINKLNYKEDGSIKNILIDQDKKIDGDFYINCLGFSSKNILTKEYFDLEYWDNYILNNSAFAIQVKNSPLEEIEPYTTSTAQEHGWSWKIPQYEKTGYGYVYSDHFVSDEEKIYNDLLKTHNIKEKDVFKTRVVKSKPYINKKQLHKNCLSIGLSSGFVEPLEATSIHMSLLSLSYFFQMVKNKIEFDEKNKSIFNSRLKKDWENILKFIVFHYFTNNPINDYWKHYKNIQINNAFEFYEKNIENPDIVFGQYSYFSVGIGMRIKDYYYYGFYKEKYLKENINDYFEVISNIDLDNLYSHNQALREINQTASIKYH